MKYLFVILFSTLVGYLHSQEEEIYVSITPVVYNRIQLEGEYELLFETNELTRRIHLIGPSVSTIIHSIHINAPEKNLARLAGDFKDYFAIYLGDYLPMLKTFRKRDGQLMFYGNSYDINSYTGTILYVDTTLQRNMCLFDVHTATTVCFDAVQTPCKHWFECIETFEIKEKELVLHYVGMDNVRQRKVFIR